MQLDSISNTDKLIRDKVNFFANWFALTVSQAGRHKTFELESPLALTNKIIFQLDYNQKYKQSYLSNYFSHEIFGYKFLVDSFPTFKPVLEKIEAFNAGGKQEKNAILDSTNFYDDLITLKTELEIGLTKKLVGSIINLICCEHDYVMHKEEIKLFTRLLVSEYIYRNTNKSDITKVFDLVLQKDIKTFPFPPEIKTRKAKQNYLNNLTFQSQFEGFNNFISSTPLKARVFLRVFNCEIPENEKFQYNQVTFYGKNEQKISKLKTSLGKSVDIFFEEEPFVIACVEISAHTEAVRLNEAYKTIRRECEYLSLISGRDLIVDPGNAYLWTFNDKDYGYRLGRTALVAHFSKDEITKLKNNPFRFLKNINSDAKRHFLRFEYLYIQASKSKNASEYWHYLEALFNNQSDDTKHIQSSVASLILLNESIGYETLFLNALVDCFDLFSNFERVGIKHTDLKSIHSNLRKRIIIQQLRKIKYPYIEELIENVDRKMSVKDYQNALIFLKGIIKETYEQRNSYMHQANNNDLSITKLENTLPSLITRLRWSLFDGIREMPNSTFVELVNALIEKSNLLISNTKT